MTVDPGWFQLGVGVVTAGGMAVGILRGVDRRVGKVELSLTREIGEVKGELQRINGQVAENTNWRRSDVDRWTALNTAQADHRELLVQMKDNLNHLRSDKGLPPIQ